MLKDDGQDGDRVAGDGIFSMQIDVRSSLSEGEMNYLIRASDIFQSITPAESQTYTIELVDEKASGGVGTNWIAENSTTLVLIGLLMLLALGATAIVVTMRNADFEQKTRRANLLISPYISSDVNRTSAVILSAIALSALASPIIAASSPDDSTTSTPRSISVDGFHSMDGDYVNSMGNNIYLLQRVY